MQSVDNWLTIHSDMRRQNIPGTICSPCLVCMWEVSQSPWMKQHIHILASWRGRSVTWTAAWKRRSFIPTGVFRRRLSSHGKIQVKMRSVAAPWRWKGIEDKHWTSPFRPTVFHFLHLTDRVDVGDAATCSNTKQLLHRSLVDCWLTILQYFMMHPMKSSVTK